MIAIMQPTYLPWIGYLAMVDRVERFVFLDTVAFARRSWQQRNAVRCGQDRVVLTVPVAKKGRRGEPIDAVRISDPAVLATKHLATIEHGYGRAPFFGEYRDALAGVLASPPASLAELDVSLVAWLCECFGISTPLVRASELPQAGARADRLVSLCEALGARTYLSAPGSREYIEASTAFEDAGIAVVYHDYEHPTYRQQATPFMSHLSCIDLLFNEGPERGLAILRSGVREPAAAGVAR